MSSGPPPLRPFGLRLHHDGRWTHEGQPIRNRRLREHFDRSVRWLPEERKYVVTLQGSTVRTWNTVPQLVEFMGTINNQVEAAIVASANGYHWGRTEGSSGIRDVFDGYEMVVLQMVRFCPPSQTNRYVIIVSAAGALRVLRSEVWSRDNTCV